MNSLFSRFGLFAVLVALLLLPANAVAQKEHIVDGEDVFNTDMLPAPFGNDMASEDSVIVRGGGTFQNGLFEGERRTIANISVENRMGQNQPGSRVTGTFGVTGTGSTGNNYGDTTRAEVRNGGVFNNWAVGTVGTFDLFGGEFGNEGTITGSGTVYGGIFNNDGGSAATLNQHAGTVHNSGTFTGVTLNGGRFENLSGGIIQGSLVMNGGTVDNAGRIDNFVYGGGTYNAIGNGSVRNLSLDARQQFDVNSLAGIANMFRVGNIDLAGADLVWNLNGLLADNVGFFGWDNIFGVDFTGGTQVALFTVNWDDGFAEFNANNFGEMQPFGNYTIVASMDGITINPAVPEPATLAILGLGLVGLGLARRRQMRRATAA